MQQASPAGRFEQGAYGQPYGGPQPPAGGGGSFLGTAAAAAAVVVGGSLLLNSIRSMMGGSHQGFGDASSLADKSTSSSPWSNQSDSNLARDAGINDIGSSGDRNDDNSRSGYYDTAAMDDDGSDTDDGTDDFDGGDFGGGDSDLA